MVLEAEQDVLDDLLPKDEDLLYEEELLRNPYSLKLWWRYIQAKSDAPPKRRYLLFERALKSLPGSYKLWYAYLRERRNAVRGLRIDHPGVESMNNTYERALVSMHKMPRIWLDYLEFLVMQHKLTQTRHAFDRALAALPITQHDRVWILYLKFVTHPGVPVETALRVYRRYLKLEPTHTEEYIAYLCARDRWGEAAKKLATVLNDDLFRSLEGKSKHQLWLELCDIITKHPKDVLDIKVEPIIRGGIRKFTDEVGRLWTALADYYIRRGMFEKVRDVYEEGLSTVVTVRDFSLIFDAYTQFEESLLSAKMEQLEDDTEPQDEEDDDGEDFLLKDTGDDIDLRFARLEFLLARRPELLSSVMLRQNPHNVHEWHKRVKLFEKNPTKQILTYTEAVKTVDPDKAVGKPHTLWCGFAKLYEKHGDLASARLIFEKAIKEPFKYVDDLASVWAEWVEMELRHKNFRKALELLRRATAEPERPRKLSLEEERRLPVQERVYKSLKLWKLMTDLEESLGTLESTRAVYDRIMELRIATPQIILNYALYLQENKLFEDSFQVYERGVALFHYPHVRDIWTAYLKQFVDRYKGRKLERARDLFEQAVAQAPADECKPIYLQYAQLEEQCGLARHAMAIYERAVKAVTKDERLSVYNIFLAKAAEFFNITKVREVYEMAIEAEPPHDLPDAAWKGLCVRYANLECKLGEIDRARGIYQHASRLADPQRDAGFWQEWKVFEVKHGNEDTFREMLRIKRSVAASYSQMRVDSAVVPASLAAEGNQGAGAGAVPDSMAALEAEAEAQAEAEAAAAPSRPALSGFVSAGVIQQGQGKDKEGGDDDAGQAAQANPEEIDLDADEDEDGDDEEGQPSGIATKAVPTAVFGALAAQAGGSTTEKRSEPEDKDAPGALERFKRRKVDGQ